MSPWLSDALLRSQSDERLVALAREGREPAFTTLVERYRKPLLGFARRLAGEGRAEDVVQQALLQAWSALQGGAQVSHPSGWLHQIVRHAAWKATASAGDGQPLTGNEPAAGDFESAVENRLAVRALVSSMAELPERQRQALLQTELEGRSRQEVAVSLGLSQGAVRQLVHRARVTLRTAATGITPWPLVAWAARGPLAPGDGGVGGHIAEVVAGAGSASVTGTLLKAGAVVVTTGALAGAVTPHSPLSLRSASPKPAQTVVAGSRPGAHGGAQRRALAPATGSASARPTSRVIVTSRHGTGGAGGLGGGSAASPGGGKRGSGASSSPAEKGIPGSGSGGHRQSGHGTNSGDGSAASPRDGGRHGGGGDVSGGGSSGGGDRHASGDGHDSGSGGDPGSGSGSTPADPGGVVLDDHAGTGSGDGHDTLGTATDSGSGDDPSGSGGGPGGSGDRAGQITPDMGD